MTNNNKIIGNLWANGSISINNPASVTGKAISSTSSISGTGSIGGDATAGTTIAAGLAVGGTRYANSPQGPPPTQVFPLLCQVAIAGVCNALPWTGYTLHTYTGASACTAARTFLRDRHADRGSRALDQRGLQPRDREQRRDQLHRATWRS